MSILEALWWLAIVFASCIRMSTRGFLVWLVVLGTLFVLGSLFLSDGIALLFILAAVVFLWQALVTLIGLGLERPRKKKVNGDAKQR